MEQVTQTIYLETRTVLKNLRVSLSTLRRTVALLRKTLSADQFDKGYCERGFSFESYLVLERFLELRKTGMPPHRVADYLKFELSQTNEQAS